MKLPRTVEGRFVRRENRFRVAVEVGGRLEAAHLPNSGRLGELLVPGRRCYLVPRSSPGRRTPYDLLLVDYDGLLVSVDARLPNPLFAEAVEADWLTPFSGTRAIQREVRHAGSRIDFCLKGPWGACWVEVKSVTLVEGGVALFPDAPTERGRRHLEDLVALVEEGHRAAVVFVVQRSDAETFAPNGRADPAFAHTLAEAASRGVEVYAYRCRVTRGTISIEPPVLSIGVGTA